MSFQVEPLDIPDVLLIKPDTYADHRGYFREMWKMSAFPDPIPAHFPQVNCSRSSWGVLRGLHYQADPDQVAKLISVVNGAVFDVAVDLRSGSRTFGEWAGAILSAENGHALYVPEGFAHGFQALEDNTVACYLMSGEFSPGHDAGVRWDDPDIGVEWPIANPILSDKDRVLPLLKGIRERVSA